MKPEVIIFEGPDASGKTYLLSKLCEYLEKQGRPYVRIRMIGGTPIGENIRTMIVNTDVSIHPATQLLLIAAARMEALQEIVYKHLKDGKHVIIDRWDLSASVYQYCKFDETTTQMPKSMFMALLEDTRKMTRILHDRVTTVVLDAPVEHMETRLVCDQRLDERFKGAGFEFRQSLRNRYREIMDNPFGSGLGDHIRAFNHETHFTFKTSSIICENVKQWLEESVNTQISTE